MLCILPRMFSPQPCASHCWERFSVARPPRPRLRSLRICPLSACLPCAKMSAKLPSLLSSTTRTAVPSGTFARPDRHLRGRIARPPGARLLPRTRSPLQPHCPCRYQRLCISDLPRRVESDRPVCRPPGASLHRPCFLGRLCGAARDLSCELRARASSRRLRTKRDRTNCSLRRHLRGRTSPTNPIAASRTLAEGPHHPQRRRRQLEPP